MMGEWGRRNDRQRKRTITMKEAQLCGLVSLQRRMGYCTNSHKQTASAAESIIFTITFTIRFHHQVTD